VVGVFTDNAANRLLVRICLVLLLIFLQSATVDIAVGSLVQCDEVVSAGVVCCCVRNSDPLSVCLRL
jgi:hypothetical protein